MTMLDVVVGGSTAIFPSGSLTSRAIVHCTTILSQSLQPEGTVYPQFNAWRSRVFVQDKDKRNRQIIFPPPARILLTGDRFSVLFFFSFLYSIQLAITAPSNSFLFHLHHLST
jgi:hypothetical protein